MLRRLETLTGERVDVRWRSFPLEQVNNENADWRFWEQPVDEVRSLRAFLAAEAVRDQGEDILRAFSYNLLRAIHDAKKPIDDPETILEVARGVDGLDVERLQSDMNVDALRRRIADDYTRGVEEYGVFGTPTFLFPDGDAVFLKMAAPDESDVVDIWSVLRAMSRRGELREIKKPRKPEPGR